MCRPPHRVPGPWPPCPPQLSPCWAATLGTRPARPRCCQTDCRSPLAMRPTYQGTGSGHHPGWGKFPYEMVGDARVCFDPQEVLKRAWLMLFATPKRQHTESGGLSWAWRTLSRLRAVRKYSTHSCRSRWYAGCVCVCMGGGVELGVANLVSLESGEEILDAQLQVALVCGVCVCEWGGGGGLSRAWRTLSRLRAVRKYSTHSCRSRWYAGCVCVCGGGGGRVELGVAHLVSLESGEEILDAQLHVALVCGVCVCVCVWGGGRVELGVAHLVSLESGEEILDAQLQVALVRGVCVCVCGGGGGLSWAWRTLSRLRAVRKYSTHSCRSRWYAGCVCVCVGGGGGEGWVGRGAPCLAWERWGSTPRTAAGRAGTPTRCWWSRARLSGAAPPAAGASSPRSSRDCRTRPALKPEQPDARRSGVMLNGTLRGGRGGGREHVTEKSMHRVIMVRGTGEWPVRSQRGGRGVREGSKSHTEKKNHASYVNVYHLASRGTVFRSSMKPIKDLRAAFVLSSFSFSMYGLVFGWSNARTVNTATRLFWWRIRLIFKNETDSPLKYRKFLLLTL